MFVDLLLFLPLAVLTNTAFPVPFDHVLIWFTAGYSFENACVFAAVGSVCAGVAGLIDVRMLGAIGEAIQRRRGWRRWHLDRLWFYGCVFVCAFLPVPYVAIRLFLLRGRPAPALYAVVVACGRLPRYVLTLYFWHTLALPTWAPTALLLSALLFALWKTWRGRPLRREVDRAEPDADRERSVDERSISPAG